MTDQPKSLEERIAEFEKYLRNTVIVGEKGLLEEFRNLLNNLISDRQRLLKAWEEAASQATTLKMKNEKLLGMNAHLMERITSISLKLGES